MTPEQLKNSILQLAIEGKLVEQRKEEGTGEELFKEIQEEKLKLIEEGTLKKQKTLPEITEDEIPFDIPETWKWGRLRDICTKIVDGDHNPPAGIKTETNYWMLSAININNGSLAELDRVRYLTKEVFEKENERTKVKPGDIFFTIVATLGRSCVYEGNYNICFQRSVSVITTLAYNYYLKYALDSGFIQQFMVVNATGTAQKGFYLNQVEKLLIPLPPLAEQKRIVKKIEELLPLVDRYEKAWTRLEELSKKFPLDMQKAILQEAIQGKLVEQRKEEGTGEELFKEIQKEKQKLIEKGKLKKQKALPEITEDETPFDIPETWKWCYIGDVFNHISGKALNSKNTKGIKHKYITTSNVYWDSFKLDNLKEMYYTEDEIEKYSLKLNDLLVLEGGDVGRAAIWNLTETYCFQNHIHRLRPFLNVSIKYFYYNFIFLKNKNAIEGKGIGIKGLSSGALHRIIIPLPPLAEQKRIVEKIEELLSICEKLK